MIPFMEYVHPETGQKTRVPWDRDRARAKREQFQAEARAAMLKRDIERGRAIGLEIPDDAVSFPTMRLNAETNQMEVDPRAQMVKHSGAEYDAHWIPRWQEFCSKPQNYEDADMPTVTYRPKQAVKLEGPITATPEPEAEEAARKKRGPGRPRKMEMAGV